MILKDLLEQVTTADLEELLFPYKNNMRHLIQLVTAFERLHYCKLDHQLNLVVVQWIRNLPDDGNMGKVTEVRCDFLVKENVKRRFRCCDAMQAIDIWSDDPEKQGLDQMDFLDGLLLATHDPAVYPMRWTSGAQLHCVLAAEVPDVFLESKIEPIGKTFLRQFFANCIETREQYLGTTRKSVPRMTTERELTPDEQTTLIRDCIVFNKISFYQAVYQVYRELMDKTDDDLMYALAMAQVSLESTSQEDLPLVLYGESDCVYGFLRELNTALEADGHWTIHLGSVMQLPDIALRLFAEQEHNAIIMIENLQDLEDADANDRYMIERCLAELIRRDKRVVLTLDTCLDNIEMNSNLKSLLEQGIAIDL